MSIQLNMSLHTCIYYNPCLHICIYIYIYVYMEIDGDGDEDLENTKLVSKHT
jgi:hypothetical protein